MAGRVSFLPTMRELGLRVRASDKPLERRGGIGKLVEGRGDLVAEVALGGDEALRGGRRRPPGIFSAVCASVMVFFISSLSGPMFAVEAGQHHAEVGERGVEVEEGLLGLGGVDEGGDGIGGGAHLVPEGLRIEGGHLVVGGGEERLQLLGEAGEVHLLEVRHDLDNTLLHLGDRGGNGGDDRQGARS